MAADVTVDDPDRTADDRLESYESRLFELAEAGGDRPGGSAMPGVMAGTLALIDRAQKAVDGISGIPTGLVDVDRRLGGLQAGELYVVAGRPGMGKTAFGLTLAVAAARAGRKVRFHSLEMAEAQLGQRLIAQRTGISIQQQRRPLTLEQHRQIAESAAVLSGLPLTIDDTDALTMAGIRTRARRQKRRGGLDMLVIDYLGLIRPADPKAPKVYQIEEITIGCKRLAKQLGIPVVLLAQLNRGVEQRDDKRPNLADLRDSGSIEQDADVVMLLYREEYYLAKEEPDDPGKAGDWLARMDKVRGVAEVITAKFRQGEAGTDRVQFDGARQRFATLEKWGR
jgi:replicative DNA helicase